MTYAVLLLEVGESLDPGRAVVGDDLDEGAPPAEDVLKQSFGDRFAGLATDSAAFGVAGEGAAAVYEVLVAGGGW